MPVRLQITLLFLTIVMIILGVTCGSIYYFSEDSRVTLITTRLLNRARTTEILLNQKHIFDSRLVLQIDSLTRTSITEKAIQAYDSKDRLLYAYYENPGDRVEYTIDKVEDARKYGFKYFAIGDREAVAYYNTSRPNAIVVVAVGKDEEGKEHLRSLLQILVISFIVGNGLILLAGYFFSGRLIRPVQKITEDVQEISAQNLTRRINPGKSNDEWSQLAQTLNQVLDRLQESFELQTRFISNASHELSTPLTSVSSQLEVSLQREREAKDYRRVMESIYQDVRNMSRLTQTLLEFAKASGSAGGLEISEIRIDEVILALPAEIMKLNPTYTVSLEFMSLPEEESELLVYGNEPLLQTAIRNIVTNACKYSSDHKATLTLDISSTINITISDKGKGMTEAELKSIFQPFYRAQESSTGQGFGLGLSLTDRIVKLHKGSIKVTSVIDQGSRFEISLPHAASFR